MTRRRALAAGGALVVTYLVVAVATLMLSDRPLRPLFDGLAPPPPYNWVNPPPEVARDNQEPDAATREVALEDGGSPFLNVTPDDGQAILLLEEGAVAPNPPDTAVEVSVEPFDALTLAALPARMTPQGNAYRVEAAYLPSGEPVGRFTGNRSTIGLVAAGPADALVFSPDGTAWQERPTVPIGAVHGLETGFVGSGYYLVTDIDDDAGAGTPAWLAVVVLAAPPLVVAALALRRRRSPAAVEARQRADAARVARRRALRPRGGRRSRRRRR